MKIFVPPIKSQGIKTKLVPWIKTIIPKEFNGRWVEPFMGTGAVAFNLAPNNALLCDINPHLINFYKSLADGCITTIEIRNFLEQEGATLAAKGEEHYYSIRERFNREYHPLDFLFLNRAGFNGMIRFNRKGGFNIPFCRKPERFAKAYITKIVNQSDRLIKLFRLKNFTFKCQDFMTTISETEISDIVYCDPPYIDRHVDYYGGWNEDNELRLFDALKNSKSNFVLSTWHHNDFRKNDYIDKVWNNFAVYTQEHFYHVGGSEKNRNPMVEALVTNLQSGIIADGTKINRQNSLFTDNYQSMYIAR